MCAGYRQDLLVFPNVNELDTTQYSDRTTGEKREEMLTREERSNRELHEFTTQSTRAATIVSSHRWKFPTRFMNGNILAIHERVLDQQESSTRSTQVRCLFVKQATDQWRRHEDSLD